MKFEPVRVVVVDDHSMVRSGLRLFLMAFEDMSLVGEAANGLEALRLVEQVRPDVVLMDLIMPVMDGIRATREMVARDSQVRIIGMTSFLESGLVQEALQSGFSGLVAKDISAADLVRAIRDVRAGLPAFSPQIAALMQIQPGPEPGPQPHPPASAAPPDFGLTTREVEVLSLMALGASNAEISEKLVISLSTVKYHVSGIFQKMRVANRAEAVALAMQCRLVDGRQPPSQEEGPA